jgi:hypothetical protein
VAASFFWIVHLLADLLLIAGMLALLIAAPLFFDGKIRREKAVAAPKFKVKYKDDRTVEVRCGPKSQVMFERHFKVTMSAFAKDPGAEYAYYLAWAGLHCAGMEGMEFDPFLDAVEDIDAIAPDEMEEPDPTRRTPGPEPSSS